MKNSDVKDGEEFEVTEVHVTGMTIVVNVPPKEDGSSFKKLFANVVIALIFSVVFSAVAYGMATGDYSMVKDIAEAGKNALEVVAKTAAKPE